MIKLTLVATMIKKLNKIQYLDTVRPDGSGRCNPKRKFKLFVLISIPDPIIYVIVRRAYNLYLSVSHFSQNGDEGDNLYISYGKSVLKIWYPIFSKQTQIRTDKNGDKRTKTVTEITFKCFLLLLLTLLSPPTHPPPHPPLSQSPSSSSLVLLLLPSLSSSVFLLILHFLSPPPPPSPWSSCPSSPSHPPLPPSLPPPPPSLDSS